MAFVDHTAHEFNIKLAYWGPRFAGRTTSIEQLYRRSPVATRTRLTSLETAESRLYFFSARTSTMLGDLALRVHLYTVPTMVWDDGSRRALLRNADAIIFVADSSPDRLELNRAAWNDLAHFADAASIDLDTFPGVLQCNKRDVTGARPTHEIAHVTSGSRWPIVASVATRFEGVLESVLEASKSAVRKARPATPPPTNE